MTKRLFKKKSKKNELNIYKDESICSLLNSSSNVDLVYLILKAISINYRLK